MLRELSKALSEVWRGTADCYRPERHYMRGPGPQWNARHGALVAVKVVASDYAGKNRMEPVAPNHFDQ